jgi:hypothetical protein
MPTYPPPPCMAGQLGVEGHPACHCPTPMAAMVCLEGHMLECHAGQTCEEAQCSHYARDMEDEA